MRQTHIPSEYNVTVYFKPMGVPPYSTTETRSVSFTTEQDVFTLPKEELFKKAEQQILSNNIIDSFALKNHWEAFKIDISTPTEPPQSAQFI
jgi:hypothetical protein